MQKLDLLLLLVSFLGSSFLLFGAHPAVRLHDVSASVSLASVSDTLPPEKKIRFISMEDDQRVELEVKNDQITYLKINDRLIPEAEYPQYQALTDKLRNNDLSRRQPAPKPTPPTAPNEQVVVFDPGTKPTVAGELRPYSGEWPTDTVVVSHLESKDKEWKEVTADTIVLFNWPPPRVSASPDLATALGQKLLQDGLITDPQNFSAELSPVSMKVNGKIQPADIQQAYMAWYEQYSGQPLGSNWISVEITNKK